MLLGYAIPGFVLGVLLIVLFGLLDPKSKNNPKALEVDRSMFKVSTGFLIGVIIVSAIIAALYIVFW